MSKWNINISNPSLGGLAPAYYKETYPSYGNKNQAGSMLNCDLTNPGYITQGPGLVDLTNGTQAGVVTTTILSILGYPTTTNVSYAIGGALLYEINATTVTSGGSPSWPRTIDKATVTGETGFGLCVYKGNLYYSYAHSGNAGDIGKFDLSSTFDDDWGSTVPTGGAALTGTANKTSFYQMIVGGNDIMYIANNRYIASYDGTTFIPQALDLPTGWIINSIQWMSDRLWITADTGLIGANKVESALFIWDGTTDSWETQIPLMGQCRALHAKNGIMYLFYRDISSTGGFKLARVNGANIEDLANFTDGIPNFYGVTDYQDYIIFNNGYAIYAYGQGDKDLPTRFFQIAETNSSSPGGVAAPFGTILTASGNGSSTWRLAKFSGYTVTSNWKSLMFDVTGGRVSKLDDIRINFEKLASGASVAWKLLDNKGNTIYTDTISHTKLGAVTTAYYPMNGKVVENFRIEFDWSSGSTTNPVSVRNIKINGTFS